MPRHQDWIEKANASYAQEDWEEAASAFEQALALEPADAEACYRLGVSRLQQGRDADALECFERSVALDPARAQAWNNLGVARHRLGKEEPAIEAYRAAAERDASLLQAHANLGRLLNERRRFAEAERPLLRAVAIAPSSAENWLALGEARQHLGRNELAAEAFKTALEKGPSLAAPYYKLGNLALGRGDMAAAEQWFAAALERRPGDATLQHMLAAVRGETPPRPPEQHVTELFDRLAPDFDRHVLEELHYRAPQALAEIVKPSLVPFRPARVLDLGCGTGLVGAALAAPNVHITGVDLSTKMLARAAQRGVYAHLVRGDLMQALDAARPASLHAIVAADTFIYLGDLAAVFAGAARALLPMGVLAFSVEQSDKDGYTLQPNGRYAHSQSYLRALARDCALRESRFEAIDLRREGSGHARGWLVVFSR